MKKEEVIKDELYSTRDGVIVKATGKIGLSEDSFTAEVVSNSPDSPNDYILGRIYNGWRLEVFSPYSEKVYETPRSKTIVNYNDTHDSIKKLLENKYISSITFDKTIKVKFTFIHNKIKFDSLQALQDTLNYLHDLNQDA